jgi:hypothetical protein
MSRLGFGEVADLAPYLMRKFYNEDMESCSGVSSHHATIVSGNPNSFYCPQKIDLPQFPQIFTIMSV